MVRPSRRREVAQKLVETRGISIKLACAALSISPTCYRYQPRLSADNARIADWLIRLTHNQRNWGFGLCFLYLRNVKGYGWNHKRVYRIYRELELNLRIKPKKRLKRDRPEPLTVPRAINQVWSMDFLHDQLADGRSFEARVDEPKGDPGNTLSRPELEDKAQRLASYARGASDGEMKAIIQRVWNLENETSVQGWLS